MLELIGWGSLLVVAVVVAVYVGKLFRRQRHDEELRSSQVFTSDEFVDYFAAKGVPSEMALAVHEYFQNIVGVQKPILPQDRLTDDLKLQGSDFTDAIRELWIGNRCKGVPRGSLPIKTVEDVVLLLQRHRPETV